MAVIADKYASQHSRIKDNISNAYLYFRKNYERYHEFRRFVFETSVTDDQKNILRRMKRPIIEFNILEAYISRLLGEFAKHEPSIIVTPSDTQQINPQIIEMVEGHIRHIIYDANKSSFAYEIYKDILSGGFSVMKVWTEYAAPMSFNQVIRLGRVFDPTLCGFDPMARDPHKGDGRFSFELYPLTEEDFKQQFPGIKIDNISYMREMEGFNWSYLNAKEERIILIGEYYEKKKKRVKIVKLANGRVITDKNYQKLQSYWQEQQFIEQIPAVVGKSRMTDLETICRYKVLESEIMEYTETDFTYLPHIFVDGNSVILRQGAGNTTYQMTRPYVYHAKGIQNLKNFSGQALGNHLENIVQHKFIVKKEAIPQEEDYIDALNNIQEANTIVVNAYSENDPDKPIPEPIREVQTVPAPPEVMATFSVTDQITQTILGSYDASLGINDNQLSGVAVIESATQTNAAAMPYIVGYLSGLNQAANCIVDLIPKYINTKRNIPIIDKKGKSQYAEVNKNPQSMMDYDQNALQVNVEAGVNYQIQKNQALQQIVALMQASESFAQFMNSKGLPILIKNLTVHGVDQLEMMAEEFQKEQQMQQQQAQQMQQQAMQNDPRVLMAHAKMADVQVKSQGMQQKAVMDSQKMQSEQQKTQVDLVKTQAQLQLSQDENLREDKRLAMEHEKHAHELILKTSDHIHDHVMAHKQMEINQNVSKIPHNNQ